MGLVSQLSIQGLKSMKRHFLLLVLIASSCTKPPAKSSGICAGYACDNGDTLWLAALEGQIQVRYVGEDLGADGKKYHFEATDTNAMLADSILRVFLDHYMVWDTMRERPKQKYSGMPNGDGRNPYKYLRVKRLNNGSRLSVMASRAISFSASDFLTFSLLGSKDVPIGSPFPGWPSAENKD